MLVDLGRVWKAHGPHRTTPLPRCWPPPAGANRAPPKWPANCCPARYPFVNEFRQALALDPANHDLRRELGYLLLRMGREAEAEAEFRILTQNAPDDLLSATQLGFLLYARGETTRRHAALRPRPGRTATTIWPTASAPSCACRRCCARAPPQRAQSIDAKIMAERSIKAGYHEGRAEVPRSRPRERPRRFRRHAQARLDQQHPAPGRPGVRAGSTWRGAVRTRASPPTPSRASSNLRAALQRFRTTAWLFPLFSTRWHDLFAYGQVKTEINLRLARAAVCERAVCRRYAADLGRRQSAVSFGKLGHSGGGRGHAGLARHAAWGEAGTAISYLKGHMLPDYRGGVSVARARCAAKAAAGSRTPPSTRSS